MDLNKEKVLKHETKKVESDFNPTFNEKANFQIELPKSEDFYEKKQILPKLQV